MDIAPAALVPSPAEALAALAAASAANTPATMAAAQAAAASLPPPTPAGASYDRTIGARKGVAAFIAKTYAMVSDAGCEGLISWSPEGTSFVVPDPAALAATVLGSFFKHSNYTSFVRQLNMYGFSKVGPRAEFYHDGFRRGRTNLLRYIKRRRKAAPVPAPAPPAPAPSSVTAEIASLKRERDDLQSGVDAMLRSQASLDAQVSAIAAENARLRDDLRAAHAAHAAMVDTVASIVSLLGPAVLADQDSRADPYPAALLELEDANEYEFPALKRQRTLAHSPEPEPVAPVAPLAAPVLPLASPSSFMASVYGAAGVPHSLCLDLPSPIAAASSALGPVFADSLAPPSPLAPLAPFSASGFDAFFGSTAPAV